MSQLRTIFVALTLASSLGALPSPAEAQGVSMAASCSEGWSTLGALGITEFSCDCTFDRNSTTPWQFRGEPQIRAVASDGPAAGRLRSGDVIVAIDGALITTRSAGVRLARLRVGEAVTLTIRRGNREMEVRLVPDEPCEPPTPPTPPAAAVAPGRASGAAPVVTPRPPRVEATPEAELAAPAPMPTPPPPPPYSDAWFGFGISCSNCEIGVAERDRQMIEQAQAELRALRYRFAEDSPQIRSAGDRVARLRREGTTWRFSEPPRLFSVDPGSPAAEAGLRRGDILLRIDGVGLTTSEGARRFGRVEPGQSVSLTYRRGGSEQTVRVRAIERPTAHIGATAEGLTSALSGLERAQSLRARELDEQVARLQETVSRAAEEAPRAQQQELVELRAQLDRINTTHSTVTEAHLARLRQEVALVEQARAAPVTPPPGGQHLRFAGSVGNTEVEVRGLSSVEVTYDNSTGELLIRTMDSTIRVKAPVGRR